MLNKNCEVCYTPIMKKDNKEYCCGCQAFLEEEKKAEPAQVKEKPKESHEDTHKQEVIIKEEISDSTSIYQNFPSIATVKQRIFDKMLQLSNALVNEDPYHFDAISANLKAISDCDTLLRQLK